MIARPERKTTVHPLFADRSEPGVRDSLIERYLPFARSLARRYQYSGQPLDDLIQVASIGLLMAVDRFDPRRGVTFESYAFPTIIGELKRYHRDQGWSVRMPRRLQERTLLIKEAVPVLAQDLGRSPSVAEVATYVHLTEEATLEAMSAQGAYSAMSLDTPVGDDKHGPNLRERLAAEVRDLDIAEEWSEFEPYLRALPERENTILMSRYFRQRTQSQIAEELGISQMHVSRLLSKTLQHLRDAVAESRVLTPAV